MSFYNQALEANQTLCKARAAVGLDHMEHGREAQAVTAFERAIRDDAQCTEAYVNLAVLQRGRGGAQVQEALNNLRRALAIEASYLPAFNEMALLYLGQAAENPRALDLAGVVCRQAQQIDNAYAPIYNTWGLVNMTKGNIIEALRLFERARSLDGNMFEAHMNFGQITLSFRGYEDARNAFGRAVELRPRDYDAVIGLGAALRGLNQTEEARTRYEAAIQIDANRPEAYFNLGILYQDYMSGGVPDMNRAKGYYEQFLAKAGQAPGFQTNVEAVQRRCRVQQPTGRRRHGRQDCRPGRLQNIQTTVEALEAAAEIERQAAQHRQNNP
jgi:tetratricopeptide (TPR) repeat protein